MGNIYTALPLLAPALRQRQQRPDKHAARSTPASKNNDKAGAIRAAGISAIIATPIQQKINAYCTVYYFDQRIFGSMRLFTGGR